jgi:hypothetical protein
MGGGHGPNSNRYGLGVDNVLEHEVVLPNGDIVIANENSNPDLFWALRGGGGGTFGILTRLTVKAYDHLDTPGVTLQITRNPYIPNTNQTWIEAITYYLSNMPEFTDFGLTGYPTLTGDYYVATLTAPGRTLKDINSLVNPIVKTLQTTYAQYVSLQGASGGVNDTVYLTSGDWQSNQAMGIASRLLSREGIKNTTLMRSALTKLFAIPDLILQPFPVAGGQVAKNANLDIGLNPAWRETIMHFLALGTIQSEDTNDMLNLYNNNLQSAVEALDPMSVNSGAYFNEVNSPRSP